MKKWECTVCGYIYDGDEPPNECPVCGADKTKFVELKQEESHNTEQQKKPEIMPSDFKPQKIFDKIKTLIIKHHLHPIFVHIPNGVIPISFIMILISFIFNSKVYSEVAFINMFFVLLSMPIVLFSGYLDWKSKYNGAFTKYFFIKITCGAVVFILSFISLLLQLISSGIEFLSLLINLVILIAAGIAGFIGGKLVFKD